MIARRMKLAAALLLGAGPLTAQATPRHRQFDPPQGRECKC